MTTDYEQPLRIGIFGMGYVGCVTAACLASEGHFITGVDVSEAKLKALSKGKAPIDEPGLGELITAVAASKHLDVSNDVAAVIQRTDMSIICVGTPSASNGQLDTSFVERVCEQIGVALKGRAPGHVVVVRSTLLPGSIARLVVPILESSSEKKAGQHFHVVFHPEFLREGSAIQDFRAPPIIVIGCNSKNGVEIMRRLYPRQKDLLIITPTEVAEMVKYTANAWHALKIVFGNEIAEICRAAKVDSHAVMNIFVKDCQLNISPAYLKPGFAFGGSCLPKDLRALTYFARHNDVAIPVLENVNLSNGRLIERVASQIVGAGVRRVGVYGLSFKPKTDDLRESPLVTLVERLIGKGIEVRVLDENIQVDKLTGANKAYIDHHLPHVLRLLVTGFEDFDGFAELVVIGHRTPQAASWIARRRGIKVLDLVRAVEPTGIDDYEGISW